MMTEREATESARAVGRRFATAITEIMDATERCRLAALHAERQLLDARKEIFVLRNVVNKLAPGTLISTLIANADNEEENI